MDTARREPSVAALAPAGAHHASSFLTIVLTLCLTALLGMSMVFASDPTGRWLRGGGGAMHPALPQDASRVPLASPAPAPSGTGGYKLLEYQDDGSGDPVRWDPCRPVHYVVRTAGTPPGGQLAIDRAVDRVQRITGLRFTFDGPTGEAPIVDRPAQDRERYGNRWSPVLVAWTDPAEYPHMKGFAGLGGPDTVSGASPGSRRYVSGVVYLNREHLSEVATWGDGQARIDAVVLHEFGHVLGLDHVDDPGELMYRTPTAQSHTDGFEVGDRRGLAALSGGPCFRDF
ncbi:matrixin family metalloprotease [Kineosporia sp. J2-2]|uniref:Matrixin family metalloprotease n=1 Tax=Kineosporia corallincola TaxID=2835133 RepID=A0ABS5TDS7_9ACTN|nr:matrixin family metalloprotease [Kineosporia corallincola]MBT0769232.1 matrixin family metalloprotease [Kineosporia corallincola]